MNIKDRRIHLFLQLFFLLVGLYQAVRLISIFQGNFMAEQLFEFQENTLPVLGLIGAFIACIASWVSSFALWTRASWAYGCSLFTSGLLFSLHLINLGSALQQNSFEIIPIIIVLIVILQSFPYLLRRSHRSM